MSKKAGRHEAAADWPGASLAEDGVNEMAVAVMVEQRIEEELARLSIDESLSDIEKAKLFLQPTAHALQQACAVAKLPQLFREHGRSAVLALTPVLGTFLDQAQAPAQVACGESFQRVFNEVAISGDCFILLLPLVLRMLGQPRPENVTDAWVQALCTAMPRLPPKIVREDLLAVALQKGRVEEPSPSRVVCATLLGHIAALGVLDTRDWQATVLKKTTALCQDTDADVRAGMCAQLGKVARGVKPEDAQSGVIPELFELLDDEQASVRAVAWETLTGLLDGLTKDVKKQKVLPLFKGMCTLSDTPLTPCFARLFGEILWKLNSEVGDEDLQAAADAFKVLARKPTDEIRQVCAWNLPGVAKVMSARRYALHLHPTLMHLAQDPSMNVRKTIAAGLHEVMAVLGPERSAQYLREPYLLLLRDDQREVLAALLPTLGASMAHFAIANVTQRTAIYGAFVPALQQAMHTSGHAWRMHKAFMEAAASFHLYFSSAQIWEQFIPLCFQLLEVGAAPVRAAAAAALAALARANKRAAQRADIAQRLVRDFAEGPSASQRILFLDFCAACRKVASTKFFRDYFMHAAIELLQDPVACVRARACAFLPSLKSAVRLPDDVALLERLNMAASQRMNDSDTLVSGQARAVSDEVKKVPVRCIGAMPSSGSTPAQIEADALDLKREDEEWTALSKEEQEEKKRLDDLAARARGTGALNKQPIGRSGSIRPEQAPGVSKYAVQRSQGSLDQAAMIALSSAALGNLTVKTSVKDKPGVPGASPPGRIRGASVDGLQPGSPWPITASAQKAPSTKPSLPSSPPRTLSNSSMSLASSPPPGSSLGNRGMSNGTAPTSAMPSTGLANGQPAVPVRRSNSLPTSGPSAQPISNGSSPPGQSSSVGRPQPRPGLEPTSPTSPVGRSPTAPGALQGSPVGKLPGTGLSRVASAPSSGLSSSSVSPKASKQAQPKLAFGSSSVKVTTAAIGSASLAGALEIDKGKVGDPSSKDKIGLATISSKPAGIGTEKPGLPAKKQAPGSPQKPSLPSAFRKTF